MCYIFFNRLLPTILSVLGNIKRFFHIPQSLSWMKCVYSVPFFFLKSKVSKTKIFTMLEIVIVCLFLIYFMSILLSFIFHITESSTPDLILNMNSNNSNVPNPP